MTLIWTVFHERSQLREIPGKIVRSNVMTFCQSS